MVDKTRSVPVPSGNDRQDIETLFRDMQPKRGRLFLTTPTVNQVEEREVVWLDDGALRRGYVKLNGVLRYWTLT